MDSRGRKLEKSVHSAAHAALCELMIQARKQAHLTQHELATRLRKPQSFVAKYEGGERRLDVIELMAICEAIQVNPLALLRKLQKATGRA